MSEKQANSLDAVEAKLNNLLRRVTNIEQRLDRFAIDISKNNPSIESRVSTLYVNCEMGASAYREVLEAYAALAEKVKDLEEKENKR